MVSLRQQQRKVYEIYDRLMFSAIGNHSDIEQIRVGAIDSAHAEGFNRSPEDVSVQRLVSFRISPAIKKVYSDPFAQPVVFKGVFLELGKTPDRDLIVTVGYDGEFATSEKNAAVAGTSFAEDEIRKHLEASPVTENLESALATCIEAWGIGKHHLSERDKPEMEKAADPIAAGRSVVTTHLKDGWHIEAGVLERDTNKESRFRLLTANEISKSSESFA